MPGLARFEVVRFVTSHRLLLYSAASISLLCAVIANALKSHSNLYSVAVHLSKSSRSVLILANFGILVALLSGYIVQRLFFGSLRPNEVERLYDRLWFFITESLLAFTIFRDDFDGPFALMFGFLLFVKAFHWLASDRIEWMDQQPYPGPTLLFHFRMTVLFAILWTTDLLMFLFAVEHTLSRGVGGMVLFASEYGILVASVMNTLLKYALSAYDLRRAGRRGGENAPPWENKSMWIFYIELATDFMKLTTYLVFFIIIITFYGLPLNFVRDVYVTARSFMTRLRALHRYQTATKNMDQRYPNATEEELTGMNDRTCIICREEMIPAGSTHSPTQEQDGPNTTPKKLPCGHIFHFHCLRSWLERQQSCPTCRRNVLEPNAQSSETAGPQGQRPNAPLGQQQPNAGAQGIPQNGNQQIGLLERLFGPPNRAGNPQDRQPNPNINNPPANGQQPGIFINYQVQYQFPRRQNDNNEPAREAPQPVPPFEGFPGPNGTWQPWPVGQAGQAPPAPTPTRTEPLSTAAEASFSGSNIETENPASASDEPSISPREAARQAALKRSGVPDLINRSSSAPKETVPLSEKDKATPSTTSVSQIRAPNLIPLFNFGTPSGRNLPLSAGLQDPTHSNRYHISRNNTFSPPPPVSNTSTTSSPFTSSPSHSLPELLTEDQLALLDRVTREAIDERLRVMERASVSIYQTMNELLSLRSALPSLGQPTNAQSSPVHSSQPESTPSGVDIGKGKAKAEEVSNSNSNQQEPESSQSAI